MRLIRFLPGALAALLSFTAVAQTAPPSMSPAQIEAAKLAAAGVSGALSNQALQLGEDGRPVYDANGKAQTQTSSASTMRDSLRTFQNYTGIDGAQQMASPGNSGRTGMVKLSVNSTFDFKCGSAPQVSSAGALAFRINRCEPTGGVTLQLCDKPAKGGTCATDKDFEPEVVVPPNVYSQMGDMQVGLGCNSTGTCRITVKGTYTVGGNDASLKQQAETAAQKADDSTIAGSLRKAITEGDYAGKMTEIGAPLKACADANEASMGTGSASTCDGQQAVTVNNGQTKPVDTGPRQCVKEAVNEQTFNRTCSRSFTLTEQISTYNYTDKKICTITDSLDLVTNKVTTTDSCGAFTNTNGVRVDPRAGYTKVGHTERDCSKMGTMPVPEGEPEPENPVRVCVEWQAHEYMVNTTVKDLLSKVGSPSAVTGACDTSALSETRVTICKSNNWFGRMLPASECVVQFTDEKTGEGTGVNLEINYADKYGCGFCVTPDVGETCYGAATETNPADTCANANLDGCTLKSATPRSYTGDGGLVKTQDETYECHTEVKTCVQWTGGGTSVSTDMTLGLENVRSGPTTADGSLNNAMVGAAILDGTAQGVEGRQQSPDVPLIFSGTEMRCKRATGGIGQLFGRNCCATDIERPIGRQLTRAGCTLDDARLAANRRSHYAHYIGDYCSRKLGFPRRCIERTETYCAFPGILPRIVHQQGREQLAQIAASSMGADIQRTAMNFNYYDKGEGSWSAPALVNGVRVSAWQWPAYCANPELAGEKLLNDPTAKECPGVVSTWIASCDNPEGCGQLPDEPDSGSASWSLHVLDPLQNITSAASRYSVVTGACSPTSNACAYTVAAWPAGKGGKVVVTRDLSWPLYSNEQPSAANVSAAAYKMSNVADLMFRGYSMPGMSGGALPSTVRLDFSRNGGQTWTTHQLPTNLRTQEFTLPNSDVRVTGYCDDLTNLCGFRITGTTTVVGKPWGSAKSPDCSGFTAGQLSAMDFGKMDLSEWLATVLEKTQGGQTNSALVSQATQQVQAYNSIYSSGGTVTAKASSPSSANFARAVPSEGFGPFDVKLVVSGVWPEITGDPAVDTDRVTKVEVDWGDCTAKSTLAAVPANEGKGFSGVRRYQGPDAYWSCLNVPGNANVTHNVKLTVYTTKSGVQTRTVKVENAFATFPGGKKNNDYVGSSATAAPSTTPAPPRP